MIRWSLTRPRTVPVTGILLTFMLAACSTPPVASKPVAEVDLSIVDDHDALSQQMARVFNWADQVQIAASVSDLADRDTITYPVHMLRSAFDEAQRLSQNLRNVPIPTPGAGEVVAERSKRMDTFLDEVDAHIRTAEALVARTPIDGRALASEADAIMIASDMAAVEHQGLLEFVSDPRLRFDEFTRIRPQHQISINYAGMMHETDAMLSYRLADWTRRWERGSERIRLSLESARKALSELAPASGSPLDTSFAELGVQDRLIGERLFALRAELAKPVPDRVAAETELGSVRAALSVADSCYRSLVENNDTMENPEYSFSESD